ncbi:MAG: hypothetical protein U5L95_00010 [Candidatus Saccharibacteria bacterium]|nr:hypothetical protein [Candidatus Saccharibacteria bacterium]
MQGVDDALATYRSAMIFGLHEIAETARHELDELEMPTFPEKVLPLKTVEYA